MGTFGEMLRRMREQNGWSLNDLHQRVHVDPGHLSRIERGLRRPPEDLARQVDDLLGARGELIAAAHLDRAAARDVRPWQTAELLTRLTAADASPMTLEALQATVIELGCQYAHGDAPTLRADAHEWIRQVTAMLRKPIGLRAHRELLVQAGWLALLAGCVEYDMGMRAGAEATRAAARQLGQEAGAAEIVGWTYEMEAWFGLTQGRYADVIRAARAGQAAAPEHGVAVQLVAQEAKALARLGDVDELRRTLERGRRLLDRYADTSERTDNHFVIDVAKWDFYEMDAARLAGDDIMAAERARAVIGLATGPDGEVTSPMRVAEAQLTLAVVDARKGELEAAVDGGLAALSGSRKSLPSLLMVASELDSELQRRYAGEAGAGAFGATLRDLS